MTRLCVALVCAATMLGCKIPTQLIVFVDSDLTPETELERISVVTSADPDTFEWVPVESGPSSPLGGPLPLSFAAVTTENLPHTARIEVTGMLVGGSTVVQVVEAEFRANEEVRVDVRLDRACVDMTCLADETCAAGECVEIVPRDD